jgi:hypothetical protein
MAAWADATRANEMGRTLRWLTLASLTTGLASLCSLGSSALVIEWRGTRTWLQTADTRARAVGDATVDLSSFLSEYCLGLVVAMLAFLAARSMLRARPRRYVPALALCVALACLGVDAVTGAAFIAVSLNDGSPQQAVFQVLRAIEEHPLGRPILRTSMELHWLWVPAAVLLVVRQLPLRVAALRTARWIAWTWIAGSLLLGGSQASGFVLRAAELWWLSWYGPPAWDVLLSCLAVVLALLLRRISVELGSTSPTPQSAATIEAEPRAPFAWILIAFPAIAVFMWSATVVETSANRNGWLIPTGNDYRRTFVTLVLCFAWIVPWALSPEKPLWRWLLYGGLATLAVTLATLAFAA